MDDTTWNRIEGGIYGMLVGDALGVPYEFQSTDEIPNLENIEFDPPVGFSRSHDTVPPGTWSDDGAQALALLESLLELGHFDMHDYARRLVAWYDHGHLAVDGVVFDVGITTASSIRALMGGIPAEHSGATGERDNGNGSLMRVLPLALWHRSSDRELVTDAHAQSHPTHAHLRSKVCCALYCLWARNLLNRVQDPWQKALDSLRQIYSTDPASTQELEFSVRPEQFLEGHGSGYVVDSLRSAYLLQAHPTYEAVVKNAVKLGNDTDTTACIAGGIAGLRLGLDAIPARWRTQLRGREIVESLLDRLKQTLS